MTGLSGSHSLHHGIPHSLSLYGDGKRIAMVVAILWDGDDGGGDRIDDDKMWGIALGRWAHLVVGAVVV